MDNNGSFPASRLAGGGAARRPRPAGAKPTLNSWGRRLSGLITRLEDWAAAHPTPWVVLAIALAVGARLALVIRTGGMIDGDEALVGIQAEHILHGEHPVYFYGQPYMGSLESYLAAAVIRVLGPSGVALRMVPVALSLALVWLTWRLALDLLPRHARSTPLLAGVAALLAAAPPLYDAVAELRTWGGQIEIYVISLALLLTTVRLRRRLRDGAGILELAELSGLWGALAGLGIWTNPLVVYALVACAVWLAIPVPLTSSPARGGGSLTSRLSTLPAAVRDVLSRQHLASTSLAENGRNAEAAEATNAMLPPGSSASKRERLAEGSSRVHMKSFAALGACRTRIMRALQGAAYPRANRALPCHGHARPGNRRVARVDLRCPPC